MMLDIRLTRLQGLVLRERENRRRDLLGFGVGHAREQRQRANPPRELLAHREAAGAEAEVAYASVR